MQHVVAGIAHQNVATVVAINDVIAGAAVDMVVTAPAVQFIVIVITEDVIVASGAEKVVGMDGAIEGHTRDACFGHRVAGNNRLAAVRGEMRLRKRVIALRIMPVGGPHPGIELHIARVDGAYRDHTRSPVECDFLVQRRKFWRQDVPVLDVL